MEVLLFFGGLLIGIGLTYMVCRKPMGKLRIDRSDASDKPYMFLELSASVGDVSRKKYIILEVSNENFIPHN